MIRVTNIRNVKAEEYDEIWAIVRSYKGKTEGIKQVADLSPSEDLFFKYWNLVKNNEWNDDSFDEMYVPQFLKEMVSSQNAKNLLNTLYVKDKSGKKVCLVCYCTEESLCHRSIVAGLLQGVGCDVVTDTGTDYTKYYRQYREIEKELKSDKSEETQKRKPRTWKNLGRKER